MKEYERVRLKAANDLVLMNRANPPDAILREVFLRTEDKPFDHIDDVISREDLEQLSTNYQRIAGYHKDNLAVPAGS